MTSPQKQDEQQEGDQHSRATRQQDASQEGDAPRLDDQTAEAEALGDNLGESQPRLAEHQDAFRGSNAEPGNPATADQDATGTRPDHDAPRAAITEAGEPMTEYSISTSAANRDLIATRRASGRLPRIQCRVGQPACRRPVCQDVESRRRGWQCTAPSQQGEVAEEQVANTGLGEFGHRSHRCNVAYYSP
jgi:hypothetical protein